MSNRPRDAIKWDQTIQVSVSSETKDKIRFLANQSDKSLSNVARELLILGLERELAQDD
jgi:predicted transcriptional regulator